MNPGAIRARAPLAASRSVALPSAKQQAASTKFMYTYDDRLHQNQDQLRARPAGDAVRAASVRAAAPGLGVRLPGLLPKSLLRLRVDGRFARVHGLLLRHRPGERACPRLN